MITAFKKEEVYLHMGSSTQGSFCVLLLIILKPKDMLYPLYPFYE